MILKLFIVLLFCIGLWAVLGGRNLIRKIIGLSLLNSAVVILFVLGGRIGAEAAPILTGSGSGEAVVDPIPQALMLTAIVVGLSISAVALILAVKIHRAYGTLDIEEIEAAGANEASGSAHETSGGSGEPHQPENTEGKEASHGHGE